MLSKMIRWENIAFLDLRQESGSDEFADVEDSSTPSFAQSRVGSTMKFPPGLCPPPNTPSHGSVLHCEGSCRPCAWFWKPEGCKNGKNCGHCHICPEGEIKSRKKNKQTTLRLGLSPKVMPGSDYDPKEALAQAGSGNPGSEQDGSTSFRSDESTTGGSNSDSLELSGEALSSPSALGLPPGLEMWLPVSQPGHMRTASHAYGIGNHLAAKARRRASSATRARLDRQMPDERDPSAAQAVRP